MGIFHCYVSLPDSKAMLFFLVGGSGNRQFPDDTLTMVQPEVLATGLVLSGAVGGDSDTGAL